MSERQMFVMRDVDINSLKPYPQNAFDHAVNIKEIACSVQQFGYNKVSIGMDEEGVLLYGHGTLAALKLLGWTTVPLVASIIGLTEEKKKAYRVADNTTGLNSRIISKMLKDELGEQQLFDFATLGLPPEHLFDLSGTQTESELQQQKEKFEKENPGFKKPIKMWMYVQFETEDDWVRIAALLGRNRSRREIDTAKLMEVINGMPKSEAAAV